MILHHPRLPGVHREVDPSGAEEWLRQGWVDPTPAPEPDLDPVVPVGDDSETE